MTANVQRMDGRACAFFLKGRCTRTKAPGDSAEARCHLMESRRKLGAATLDRLDRLRRLSDPKDREVARRHILQKNVDAITRLSCQDYVPAGAGQVCLHQHLVYCVHLLPLCEGRCKDFLAKRPKHQAMGGGGR